eukprot:1720687-Amphidinium_carterae.1
MCSVLFLIHHCIQGYSGKTSTTSGGQLQHCCTHAAARLGLHTRVGYNANPRKSQRTRVLEHKVHLYCKWVHNARNKSSAKVSHI